jgi:chromosome partitioning protein
MKSTRHALHLPRVIVLASGKGGVGKSTLARSLAAHWLSVGQSPAIVDADPQASIISLHDAEGAMAKVSVVADPEVETIKWTIDDLATRHSMVLVDTAGFRNQTTIMACISADIVVIPFKAAAEDVREALAMLDLINELNVTPERSRAPIDVRLVMTMVTPGTLIARQVRKELEKGGYPILDTDIVQRVTFPELSMRGLAPSIVDPDGAAARNIAAVATELTKKGGHGNVVQAA